MDAAQKMSRLNYNKVNDFIDDECEEEQDSSSEATHLLSHKKSQNTTPQESPILHQTSLAISRIHWNYRVEKESEQLNRQMIC